MAKVGNVSPTGGTSDAIKAVVMGDLTPNLTLGQVAAAALSGTEDDLVVSIDLVNRTVAVQPAADSAKLEPSSYAAFTQDDASKKVSFWTGTGDGDLSGVANATAKPQRSLASLISAVEDFLAGLSMEDELSDAHVVIDQVAEKVVVYDGNPFASTPSASLATFEAPVATTSGTPRGPFE